MNEPIVELRGVSKRYRDIEAMKNVSLSLEAGSICGLLGPNGAGKTTTFKCLLGFAKPTRGEVLIGRRPLRPETFEHLAYVPEKATLYEWLRIEDHLAIQRRSYRNYDDARARELLARFDLDPHRKTGKLSKGMKTAVAIVLAFSIRPRILVLDEPASGLDPIHQRDVLDLMIEAAANGATVIFSSHQVTLVERACDRVAIMRRGEIVVDREIDELKAGEKIIEAIFAGGVPPTAELAADPRVLRVESVGATLRVVTREHSDELAQRVFALGPKSLRTIDLDLEEIFMNAVKGAER